MLCRPDHGPSSPGAPHGLLCLQAAPQVLAGALVEPPLISAAVSAFYGQMERSREQAPGPALRGAAPASLSRARVREAAPDGSPHCEPPPAEPGGQGPPGGQRWSTAQTLDPGASAAVCPQARGSPSLGGSCSSVERGDGSGWGPGRTATALLAPSSRYRRRRGREVDDRLSQGLPQHQRRLRVPSWLRALQHPGALSVSVRPPSSRLSVLPPRGLRRRLDPQPVCPLHLGRLHTPSGCPGGTCLSHHPSQASCPPPPPRPSSGPSGWAVSSWARDRSREQTGAPSITAESGHDPLRGPWEKQAWGL